MQASYQLAASWQPLSLKKITTPLQNSKAFLSIDVKSQNVKASMTIFRYYYVKMSMYRSLKSVQPSNIYSNDLKNLGRTQMCARAGNYFSVSESHSGTL